LSDVVLEEYEQRWPAVRAFTPNLPDMDQPRGLHRSPREDGEEPARAITLALEDAGAAPASRLCHLHGTSTELNDRSRLAGKAGAGDALAKIPTSARKYRSPSQGASELLE